MFCKVRVKPVLPFCHQIREVKPHWEAKLCTQDHMEVYSRFLRGCREGAHSEVDGDSTRKREGFHAEIVSKPLRSKAGVLDKSANDVTPKAGSRGCGSSRQLFCGDNKTLQMGIYITGESILVVGYYRKVDL